MLRRKINDRRRAIILVVVLSLLGLFSIVGVTFVMYADKQAMASYHWRQARWFNFSGGPGSGGPGTPPQPPFVAPDVLFRWAVGELIYDVADDDSGGFYSAIRGHSLARNMYGYNWQTLNTVPFNGRGKVPYDSLLSSGSPPAAMRNDYLINHVRFPGTPLRYPERIGSNGDGSINGAEPGTYLFEGGAGYTFPDINHLFLGATRADGLVLARTFHRPEIFGSLDPSNPNWTNAEGKYLSLRYRPADMSPLFPFPTPEGDVKNRVGAPGGNDSVWIDLGFPVQTAAGGRKFKPLFAYYVEELDSKINYNVHGNRMATAGTHGSNQGWGRWEVNPQKVLNGPQPGPLPEWYQLFTGEPSPGTQRGRYGSAGNPHDGQTSAPGGKRPSRMAQVDYNGREASGTDKYSLFDTAQQALLNSFPQFPANRYSNGFTPPSNDEVRNHARLYNYFSPFDPFPPTSENDYALPVDDLYDLMYDGFTGTNYRRSQVYRLLVRNLDDGQVLGTTEGVRRRNLITPLSMQINRPSIEPMFWDRRAVDYAIDMTNPQTAEMAPVGAPETYRRAVADLRTPPVDGDFHPSWRDSRAQRDVLEKLNLDTVLPLYPHQATGVAYHTLHSDANAVRAATAARQAMAEGIYRRLLFVTGARPPSSLADPTSAADREVMKSLRYLAQLAVNIVDYIDEDEINTPFLFYPVAWKFFDPTATPPATVAAAATTPPSGPAGERMPTYWVFGTELPQVVLNEALVNFKYQTDPTTGAPINGPFKVNVWAELFCPLPTGVPTGVQASVDTITKYPLSWPAATNGFSAYQLVIAGSNNGTNPIHNSPENGLGLPDEVRKLVDFPSNNGATVPTVDPANPAVPPHIGPLDYFLVGPNDDDGTGVNATITTPGSLGTTPWYKTANMSYDVNLNGANWVIAGNPVLDERGVTVVLRRLANPHLSFNGDQTSPDYNPYITVDYVEGGNAVQPATTNMPRNATTATAVYNSWGKQTVYRSQSSTVVDQVPGAMPPPNIRHTLANRNAHTVNGATQQATAGAWLVHLDRQLSSVFELLEVHARSPWKLTHFFTGDRTGPGVGRMDHRVAWRDEDVAPSPPPVPPQPPTSKKSHRLYRLFEMIDVGERAAGTSFHGRVPGRVNFNCAWENEIPLAVADASPANFFNDGDVGNQWGLFTAPARRSLPYPLTPGTHTPPRPVRSFGAAHTSDLDGIHATYLGNDDLTNNRPLFQFAATDAHPTLYQRNELLTKMGNTMTTRSNVFAVWLTVGYFDVTDETTQPVKLGAEIGDAATRIRHRFFCIVDRSALTIAQQLTTSTINPANPNDPAGQVTQAQVVAGQPARVTLTRTAGMSNLDLPNVANPTAPPAMCIGTIRYNQIGAQTLPVHITRGSLLVVDSGQAQETVMVTNFDATNNWFEAVFVRPHSQGFRITMAGNPGPQPGFDPISTVYRDVVPFWAEVP